LVTIFFKSLFLQNIKRWFPDAVVPANTILVCRRIRINESGVTRAASVMLLDAWDLSLDDCVLPIAHRAHGSQYDHFYNSSLRSSIKVMVHCSHLLLESDWPMPACSERGGLFFGCPKTQPAHSLFAAAWDTRTLPYSLRPHPHTHTDLWMHGDSISYSPSYMSTSYTFVLLGFVKQKKDAWQVSFNINFLLLYLLCS